MDLKNNNFLNLLHLSDIHFKYEGNEILDLNADIRNELERDLRILKKEAGTIDGILIGGDIAYGGKREEYQKASEWIDKVCEICGCSSKEVLVVPGNHDIDRNKIGIFGRDFRNNIRAKKKYIDESLREYIDDDQAKVTIFEPLLEFNKFASKYSILLSKDKKDFPSRFGCMTSSEGIHWEKDFILNDGSKLRICGLNSALISDDTDNDGDKKLIISSFQTSFSRIDGVEYLTLCHHPPSWLFDGENLEQALIARAKIHLFGHKHKFNRIPYKNSIRVAAGAVHPDPDKDWQPRYNIIGVRIIKDENGKRKLNVRIYPRLWDEINKNFKAEFTDNSNYIEEEFDLEDWEQTVNPKKSEYLEYIENVGTSKTEENYINMDNPEKTLVHKFLSLPYHNKISIANELGLTEDEDEDINDVEKGIRYFQRAKQKSLLKKLWKNVDKLSPFDMNNPF